MIHNLVKTQALISHILLGVKLKIWEYPLQYPEITNIWEENDLIFFGELTDKGQEMVDHYFFLKYENEVSILQANAAVCKTSDKQYTMLRKGLENIFKSSILPLFKEVLKKYSFPKSKWLDLGQGIGQYSKVILQQEDPSQVITFDRVVPPFKDKKMLSLKGDIFASNSLIDQTIKFDFIMCNDLLHCFTQDEIILFIELLIKISKSSSIIIIGEQIPTPRMVVRMKSFSAGKMFSPKELNLGPFFSHKEVLIDNSFYFSIFERI